jgi:ribonucleoside-diphosphate reductase beta chain
MRRFEKAKRLGVWNPSELDFSRDGVDWKEMSEERRDAIVRLTGRFLGGEEAVTLDLLPLVLAIAREAGSRRRCS